MIFKLIAGRRIVRHGTTPVLIRYGVMPLIALAPIVFALGPLRPHPRLQAARPE
jgi:hypothetical protein